MCHVALNSCMHLGLSTEEIVNTISGIDPNLCSLTHRVSSHLSVKEYLEIIPHFYGSLCTLTSLVKNLHWYTLTYTIIHSFKCAQLCRNLKEAYRPVREFEVHLVLKRRQA